MNVVKTYNPNNKTRPIKTRLAELVSIFITLQFVAFLFYFCYSSHPKLVLVLTPFLLLLGKEFSRLWRLIEIKKKRYSAEKPYSWKVESQEKEPYLDYEELKDSFSRILADHSQSIIFFIERVTPEDHQAKIYEKIYQDLKKENRIVRRFFHRGDYEVFWNEDNPNEIKVEKLVDKFQNWLPIFCSDGHRLIDAGTKALSDAVFPFYIWKYRILLSNRPSLSWSHEEDLLSVVFTIVSFNIPGVSAIKSLLKKRSGLYPYPHQDEKPELVLKDDDVQIFQKLEAHFGSALTTWIAATAICSKLDWDLTLKIGKHLSSRFPDLTKHANIRQLSRLGWYRVEEMPDSVRKQLLHYLPVSLQNEIRLLVVEALEENPPVSPSHANNKYRMELVSHKLLIPDFPQKNLKEEYYELKSMGYLEDATMSEQLNSKQNKLYHMLPSSLQQYAYNEGGALFGWNLKLLIPFLFLFAGVVAMVPSITPPPPPPPPPPNTRTITGSVTDILGNKINNATIRYEESQTESEEDGQFKIEIPSEKDVVLAVDKDNYLIRRVSVGQGQERVSIKIVPKNITVTVIDGINDTNVKGAMLLVGNNSISTDEFGVAKVTLDNTYLNKNSFTFIVEKEGYETQSDTIYFDEEEFVVYLKEELKHYKLGGVIKNSCNGEKLNEVTIKLYEEKMTTTNKEKFIFSFKAKPSTKKVEIYFSKGPYHEKSKIFQLSELDNNDPNIIELTPKTITVIVVDAANRRKGIKDAKVTISGKGNGKTDDNGEYTFNVEKDFICEAIFNISHPDYEPFPNARKKITELPFPIKLTKIKKPGPDFIGIITDQCDNPIEEVIVNITNVGSDTSDKNGRVNIPLKGKTDRDKIQVTYSKTNYHSDTKTYEVSDLKNDRNFKLSQKDVTIRIFEKGKLNKNRLKNAQITVSNRTKPRKNQNGDYIISLRKGEKCLQIIQVSQRDYISDKKQREISAGSIDIYLEPVPTSEPEEITFTVTVTVSTAVSTKRNFLEGVTITLNPKGFSRAIADEIKAKGKFSKVNGKPGVYQLIIEPKSSPKMYEHIKTGKSFRFSAMKRGHSVKPGSVSEKDSESTIEMERN